MAEDKDTGFRITDRRKFNPDGSPREHTDEPEAPAAPPVEPVAAEPPPAPESYSDNVVSFPSDQRKREPEAPPAEPPPAEPPAAEPRAAEAPPAERADAAADARAAQAKAAASAAEQAYNQSRGPQSPQLPEASFLTLIDMFA